MKLLILKKINIVLFFGLFLIGVNLQAADHPSITFDLTEPDKSRSKKSAEPGVYYIEFTNLVPNKFTYTVNVVGEIISLPPLQRPGSVATNVQSSTQKTTRLSSSTTPQECLDLAKEMSSLSAAATEDESKTRANVLRNSNNLSDCNLISYRVAAENELSKTTRSYEVIVKEGQKVTVSLQRGDGSGNTKWSYAIESAHLGKFIGNWGIAVLPNQDEDFFSKDDGAGGFTVTAKDSDNGLDLIPAIFYTYVPNYDAEKKWVNGPSLGLGVDQENLSLFLGWNLSFRTRFGLTAGIAVHKQQRLLGEFTNGQGVSESVETLTESEYHENLFIALVYSFGE